MAEQNAAGGGSFPLNLQTLLVLLALVSSVWLVSQKLTSTRPAALAGKSPDGIGEQTVEARLWEDPFKPQERDSEGPSGKTNANSGKAVQDGQEASGVKLRDQIQKRVGSDKDVLILPVMIPGGFYSEDQEIRIRSRLAIGSALGQSGYAPNDAERIGSVTLLWPTITDNFEASKNPATEYPRSEWPEIWPWLPDKKPSLVNERSINTPLTRLDLRYEWYRQRELYSPRNKDLPLNVLVLWLNERYFEDEPLLRLPMLLEPIMHAVQKPNSTLADQPVALIGPYFSSTLRAMLSDRHTRGDPLQKYPSDLPDKIRQVLGGIAVYSATATAMDATLIPNRPEAATNDVSFRESVCNDVSFRESVCKKLTAIGFKSFQNFVATDDQLAEAMLKELKLRGVDFANKTNYLVLIAEWDTFYARVLSLTYAAELARRQGVVVSRDKFVDHYIKKSIEIPENLQSFVYLRGLDGQTVGHDVERGSGNTEAPEAISTRLDEFRKLISNASKDDLLKWTPDANKAEGQAQFDYLSRLGEQLAVLEKEYSKEGKHIKAVGVVGSDVYDTMLILQALRHRVPNALFFTTNLDARFWHPRELSWTRNLLVTSSYDLMLNHQMLTSKGQMSIPPFRDSGQTAQFTAALAALGELEPPMLRDIPPRRFEIGKRGPVNLSVGPSDKTKAPETSLHPPRPQSITPRTLTYVGIGIVCLAAGFSLTLFCGPLRRLTLEATQFQTDTLRYREEDVGGIEGAWTLVQGLQESAHEQQDRLAQWLWSSANAAQHEEKSADGLPTHDFTDLLDRIEKAAVRSEVSATTTNSGQGTHAAASEVSSVQGLRPLTESLHMADAVIGTSEAKQALDKEKSHAVSRQECEYWKEELLRKWLDFLNSLLYRKSGHPGEAGYPSDAVEQTRLPPDNLPGEWKCWWFAQPAPHPERPESPQQVDQGRKLLDALLQKLGTEPRKSAASVEPDMQEDILRKDILGKARTAREASLKLYDLRQRWVWYFKIGALAILALAIGLSIAIWRDTFATDEGELFSLITGTSAWPGEVLRFAAFVLAISLSFQAYQSLQTLRLQLTRRFRLPLINTSPPRWSYRLFRLPASPAAGAVVDVATLWQDYQHYGTFGRRMRRMILTLGLYILFSIGLNFLSRSGVIYPLRGPVVKGLHFIFFFGAGLSFLFLTFMIIDAARLCQWFIQNLCEAPTVYPPATLDHFSRLHGHVDRRYLDEWIDLMLIADLTAHVGRLVYYPFIVFFLLLLARNEWWDHWPWPWGHIAILVCNLTLAAASIIILQNAARKAKKVAEATLQAKVKRLRAATAESQAQNNTNQAQELLEEIRALRHGAFVPVWENPVLSAVLLPSVCLELL